MTVEADIRTVLLSFSGVTSLVGTGNAARIRPDKLEQDDDETSPYIIIEVDNEEHLNDITGRDGLKMCSVVLRIGANQKATARTLAESVRTNDTNPGTGLAGYDGTVNGHQFDAYLESEATSFTSYGEGSDRGYWEIFADYMIILSETR